MLFGQGADYVETWVPADSRWELHQRDTVCLVETGATLLYRSLPDSLVGIRLDDCPGLAVELAKFSATQSKRKQVEITDSESDSLNPRTPACKRQKHAPTPTQPAPSRHSLRHAAMVTPRPKNTNGASGSSTPQHLTQRSDAW